MTTLFDLSSYETATPIHDPYWDEIVLDISGKIEPDGQTTLFYDDSDEPPDPDDHPSELAYLEAWDTWQSSHEPYKPDMQESDGEFLDVVLEDAIINVSTTAQQKPTLPEQTKKQWLELYAVTRNGLKYWYYRYCYYDRKIHHIHIPGGNAASAIANERKELIERAIALGKTPLEILHFIKGGFGRSGFRLAV